MSQAGSFNGGGGGGSGTVSGLVPDSGTSPVIPNAGGNITLIGSGSITTVGSLNTETIQLTGLTTHAVLVGAGTTTITKVGPTATIGQVLQSAGAAADPAFSTATYPLTTTVSEILYSSAANVISGLATANRAVLTTGTTGIPVMTALAMDGQLIIGSTAGQPAAATLTAGTGVTITPGANSISIAASAGILIWTSTSGTFTAAIQNGYFLTAASTPTMPAAPAEGDMVAFVVDAAATITITANTGQKLRLASTLSATAGTCVTSLQGNTITFVYRSTGATWFSLSASGAWNVT